MATKPAVKPPPPAAAPASTDSGQRDERPAARDVRSPRPDFLSHNPLRTFARRLASIAALVVLDIMGLALALYLALVLRELYYGKEPLWGLLWEPEQEWLPFVVLITVLVFWRAGLYAERERRAGLGRVLSSLILVTVLAVFFGVSVGHDFNTYAFAPTALVLAVVLISLFRASYEAVTRDLFRVAGIRRRAVLVGDGERLADLHRALGFGRSGIEYEFVGVVSPSPDRVPLPLLGDVASLPEVFASRRVDELILVEADFDERDMLEIVDHAHGAGVKVRIAPTTTELLTHRAEYVPGQAVPLFELRPPVFVGADWVLKRTFDLVVGTAVLVVGLPVWALIALAIKLDSPGPVLYRDRRVGLRERDFLMLKFRTMHVGAAERQAQLEERNEATGALFKIRDDPRVTRVGAFLRRFSIDEVPQLLNVLRGEMSLVGPRPLPVRDFEKLDAWHRKRYLVLPGMTGLWQISGRSSLSFDDLVRLDFYYLENWSVWLDVSILAKTVPAVLAARGAY